MFWLNVHRAFTVHTLFVLVYVKTVIIKFKIIKNTEKIDIAI